MTYEKRETIEGVAADIQARLAGRRKELDAACHQRPLVITPPTDCPADLSALIEAHNGRAVAFGTRRDAVDEASGGLALAMRDRAADPADLVKQAAKLRVQRYALVVDHLGLLEAREPLLARVAGVLEAQAAEAEEAVGKARDKARAALKKAGWQPPAARGGKAGQQPAIEERQWVFEIDQAAPVAAARNKAADVHRALGEGQQLAEAVGGDIDAVGQNLIAAWRALVGPLV